jgi:hypothetical protein
MTWSTNKIIEEEDLSLPTSALFRKDTFCLSDSFVPEKLQSDLLKTKTTRHGSYSLSDSKLRVAKDDKLIEDELNVTIVKLTK